MREAEMADLKKSFDDVKGAATGITSGGTIMTSLQKDVSDAVRSTSRSMRRSPPRSTRR